jgi:outer membrane receptor protein involved in Fe transport
MTANTSAAVTTIPARRKVSERRLTIRLLASAASAGWLLAAVPALSPRSAHAQEALEPITVTAQRRTEDVQSVPMSLTVVDATQIEQRDVKSFIDYGTTIPNLSFGYSGVGYSNARTIAIRGIAGDNTTGFYLDDTPLPDTVDPRVVDIDRIEVLRGPQGTLYGARSEGGTVRLITEQPSDDFSIKTHVGSSDTWNTVEPNRAADAAINVPLIPQTLDLRIVALYDYEAGFFRRTFPTVPLGTDYQTVDNVAANETTGGSISLSWKVTDALTVTPRMLYQNDEYNGFPYSDHTTYTVPPPTVAPTNLNLDPNNFVQTRLYDIAEGGHDRWSLASLTMSYKTGFGDFVSSTSYFNRDVFEVEDLSDYNYQILGEPFDTPVSAGTTVHQFVQEVRFASQFSGPAQFVGGVYFEATDGSPLYEPPAYAHGLNAYFGGTPTNPASGLNPLNPDEVVATYQHERTTEPALYGELSYQLSEPLKLITGARLYRNENTSYSWQEGIVVGGPRITDPPATLTQSGVNPKIELQDQLTPQQMIYATASKGFRPGGINPAIPTAFGCGASLAQLGVTAAEANRFKSDSLWNYELGTKTSWLDQRLTVDGAVYYIDWKDLQQDVLLACGFGYTGNVGSAKSEGFELETHARPASSLDLSAGVGYEHAVITESSTTSPQQPGSPVYQVPDWTANVAATQTHTLTSAMALVSNLTYGYVGHSWSANNNPFDPRLRAAYGLLDARFALKWEHYQLALVGKNLQNTHANLADNASIGAEVVGRPRIVTNQPRTVGLDFFYKY